MWKSVHLRFFPPHVSNKQVMLVQMSKVPLLVFFLRATPVRAGAAAEEEVAAVEEAERGMRTTRSPLSRPPTTPTLPCCTSWSTRRATPSTPCRTTACSTPTPTRSCPPSGCPTCWVRTPTSSQGRCTLWVPSLPQPVGSFDSTLIIYHWWFMSGGLKLRKICHGWWFGRWRRWKEGWL